MSVQPQKKRTVATAQHICFFMVLSFSAVIPRVLEDDASALIDNSDRYRQAFVVVAESVGLLVDLLQPGIGQYARETHLGLVHLDEFPVADEVLTTSTLHVEFVSAFGQQHFEEFRHGRDLSHRIFGESDPAAHLVEVLQRFVGHDLAVPHDSLGQQRDGVRIAIDRNVYFTLLTDGPFETVFQRDGTIIEPGTVGV